MAPLCIFGESLATSHHLLQEDVLHDEDDGQAVHEEGNLFPFACEQVDDDIRDDAERDAFGDAVAEGHRDDGDVCRDGFAEVVEVDAGDGRQHEEADDDQGRCRGKRRDGHEERRQEEGQGEENSDADSRQARAAAFADAGGAFDEGRRRTGAEDSADRRGDGVGQEGAFDVRQAAPFIEHVGFGRDADERAQGIEDVDEEEGEHDD